MSVAKLEELTELLRSIGSTLRGMTLDSSIPDRARNSMGNMCDAIESALEEDDDE